MHGSSLVILRVTETQAQHEVVQGALYRGDICADELLLLNHFGEEGQATRVEQVAATSVSLIAVEAHLKRKLAALEKICHKILGFSWLLSEEIV